MSPGRLRRRIAGVLCAAVIAVAGCGHRPAPAAPDGAPARRIVTLSPHLGELVYSAGAGDELVGVVAFSDYPEAVRRLPQVGDAFRVDEEAIAGLHPDLILGWRSGNPAATLARLGSLGFRVVTVEPAQLADIASHIRLIGRLAGTSDRAEAAAAEFSARLAALRDRYAQARRLRVFMELSARPWFTVSDQHVLGQGITLCGGDNVFGSLPGLAASVSAEAVLEAAPEVIIASDTGGAGNPHGVLDEWRRWSTLPAVRQDNLYLVDADLLSRPGARILDGIEQLCGVLERARQKATLPAR